MRSQELKSNVFRINNLTGVDDLGRTWCVGNRVEVDGHGRASVSGIACCGFGGHLEVTYEDGTKYHVLPRQCTMMNNEAGIGDTCKIKKLQWADVEDPDGDVQARGTD